MAKQTPQDPNKIDLTPLNQQPKQKIQFKLPSFLSRKKSAGPGRDHLGQFSSGSGGLKSAKKFNWSRALPLVLVISLAGGYMIYRSFAGTYRDCSTNANSYTYSEECVTDSNEAATVRLYYGIFNRAPDKSGLQYWAGKLNNKSITLTEMARQFMGSSEFKKKYGTLSDAAFVQAMYPQVFGRAPDSGGLSYWTNKLTSKKITRQTMMVQFTQSSEMKNKFTSRVAGVLGIEPASYVKKIVRKFTSNQVSCYGQIKKTTDGKQLCSVGLQRSDVRNRIALASASLEGVTLKPGAYAICASMRSYNTAQKNIFIDVNAVKGSLSQGTAKSEGLGGTWGGDLVDEETGLACDYPVLAETNGREVIFNVLPEVALPVNSNIELDMSSVQIAETNVSYTTAEILGKVPERTSERTCKLSSESYDQMKTYQVGDQKKCVSDIYNFYKDASATTTKPDWVHAYKQAVTGEFGVDATFFTQDVDCTARGTIIRARVKDAYTGKPVSADLYQRTLRVEDKWYKFVDSSKQHNVYNCGYSIWVGGKTTQPILPIVEIEVLGGSADMDVARSREFNALPRATLTATYTD